MKVTSIRSVLPSAILLLNYCNRLCKKTIFHLLHGLFVNSHNPRTMVKMACCITLKHSAEHLLFFKRDDLLTSDKFIKGIKLQTST